MFTDGCDVALSGSPLEVLARWPAARRVMMLHSGRPHARWSRWTVLAEPAETFRFSETVTGSGKSEWIGGPLSVAMTHRPIADLRQVTTARPGLWVGYISYDVRLWTERVLCRGARQCDDRGWPIVEFANCPGYLVHDTLSGRWRAHGTWREGGWPDLNTTQVSLGISPISVPTPDWTRSQYETAVRRVRDYIAAGDVFQVNLAQRFTAAIDGPHPHASRHIFQQLASISPAWYGAYLELTAPGGVLMSTSPELFLQVNARGQVITRPIKGTRPAAANPEDLFRSAKDAAELAMIVDLLRNDLGRVCAYGSVCVTEARTIESHPTVHHGVATISGQLHRTRDLFDLLRATMPGGSVTGAPKIRAMQIIDELEHRRRGPYCGAIGYIDTRSGTPSACLNVAIRTMLHDVTAKRIALWAGGGIVADSDPAAEYDETLDKAAAMFASLR